MWRWRISHKEGWRVNRNVIAGICIEYGALFKSVEYIGNISRTAKKHIQYLRWVMFHGGFAGVWQQHGVHSNEMVDSASVDTSCVNNMAENTFTEHLVLGMEVIQHLHKPGRWHTCCLVCWQRDGMISTSRMCDSCSVGQGEKSPFPLILFACSCCSLSAFPFRLLYF